MINGICNTEFKIEEKDLRKMVQMYTEDVGKKILEMIMKQEKFSKYFKFPLKSDEWGGYVWDSDGNMVMSDIGFVPLDLIADLVNGINGEPTEGLINTISYSGNNSDAVLTINGKHQMDIRGWGHLTGSCKLSPKEAASVQDEFGEWIVSLF